MLAVGASGPGAQEPTRLHPLPVEEEAHFWDYWRVLVRRRWSVFTVLVVSLLAAIVWTFTTRPIYRATMTIRIDKEEPRVLKFEEVVRPDSVEDYNQSQLQTQYKLLESRTLARRVIGLLQLDQHPEFHVADGNAGWLESAQTWARERLVRWAAVPPPSPPPTADGAEAESSLTGAFLARLSVDRVRNSRLVRVSFDSHHPELATQVVNTLGDAFIAQQLDHKVEATRYATQFLAKQMEAAREKLEASERRLNAFLGETDIVFVGGDKERQDLVTQQLTLISDALLRARTERIAKESLVKQALTGDADSLPAVLKTPLIARLKEELATQEAAYRKLGQAFKPEYPRMQRLAETIAEVRRQLQAETARVVEALDAEYQAALATERELRRALDDQHGLARRLGDRMAQYSLLRREVDTNRDLYTSLLTRLKETQIASALFTSNISIADRAEVPLSPAWPNRSRNLLLGALLGVFGGIGVAFLREYLDTNIRDGKEVEAVLRVPTLGFVPSQALTDGGGGRHRRLAASTLPGPFALAAHARMDSVLAEAFRTLRTSLLYSTPDHPPKTLLVTSLYPEDGKTSLATNLAIALAQLGAGPVLLVDGDMRRADIHRLFGVPRAPGLSTFLTGQAELDEVIRPTQVPNLHVLPAGRVPLNPAELLAGSRLGHAQAELESRFAHVVFDAPPVFGVSDALILGSRVDGVVLVLRYGRASRDAAQRATQVLASVRARLLGVILNDVDGRAAGAGYSSYYGYYRDGYHAVQSAESERACPCPE